MLFSRPPNGDASTRARPRHLEPAGPSGPPLRLAAARSPEPVAAGDLVALPILLASDGMPLDLQEVAEGHAIILVFLPPDEDAARRAFADVAALTGSVKAAGGDLFAIAHEGVGATAAPLLVDPGGRFAYTLGLADWDYGRGRAHLGRAAGFALDAVGRVIAVELEEPLDLRRLLDALPPALPVAPNSDPGAW